MTDDKTGLDLLAAEIRKNPLGPHVVLVGSNFLGIHLRHTLAEITGGHANVRFLTFVDLATALTRGKYLAEGRRDFPADAEELLLGELCRSLPRDSPFSEARDQPGFARALRSTFHDLIDADVVSLPGGSRKRRELSRLFREHRQSYLPRFATTGDRIRDASSAAETFREFFQTSTLYTYGFYDLTAVQMRLLVSLGRAVSVRTVPAVTGANDPSAFFRAFSATDPFSEAEEVTRSILALVEGGAVPLHRVGILLRNPEEALPPFVDALDRAGLPYYREGGAPIAETNLGKAIARGVALPGNGWNRTEVLRCLTSFPFRRELLAAPGIGLPADWDRWTREAFVTSGVEEFRDRLAGKHPSLAEFLRGFFDAIEKVGSATEWCSFGNALSEWVSAYAEPDDSLAGVLKVFRGLSDLSDLGVATPPETLRSVLSRRLSKAHLRDTVFERDGVFVGSIASARMIRFDYISIPGLSERSFPTPPRPDPILLDFERREINEETGSRIPLKEARLAEERQLFDLAVLQGTKGLLLSYARSAAGEDRQRFPSSFLTRYIARRGGSVEDLPRLPWEQPSPAEPIDAADWIATEVARRVITEGEKVWGALAGWTPLADSVRAWTEERLGSRSFGPFDGLLTTPSPSSEGPASMTASQVVTYATCPYRFFLHHRLRLRPLIRADELRELRAIDRGEILHEVLYLLFTELRMDRLLPLRPEGRGEIERRLTTILDRVFREISHRLPLGPSLLRETERSFLLADLRALLDAETRETTLFLPAGFEVRFGKGTGSREDRTLSTDRSLTIAAGHETIAFEGKIDRIDLSPDRKRARIVDYKNSHLRKAKEESFDGGKSVQLPVYLSALPLFFPAIDLAASEAILLSTAYGSGFRRIRFSGSALVARHKEFETILATISRGIRSSLFPPIPGENGENCSRCDYRPICGPSVLRLFDRKKDDPTVLPLLEMGRIE